MSDRAFYLRLGAVLGALAVIIGAFGAHGLESILPDEKAEIFETGVRYQFYHALAIIALAAGSSALWASPFCLWSCRAWAIGILIFSGTLYALAMTQLNWLGAITPIGGLAMIAGWILLALAAGTLLEAA